MIDNEGGFQVKKINLLFYKLATKYDFETPHKLREQLWILNRYTARKFGSTGKDHKLIDLQVKPNGLYVGTIVSGQMVDIPPSIDFETDKLEGLGLNGTTKGLATSTSFLIDPQANILVKENISGKSVSASLMAAYFKSMGLYDTEPQLLINPGQLQEFYKLNNYIKFELKIAPITSAVALQGNEKEKDIDDALKLADDSNADFVNITLGINRKDHKDKSLLKSYILNKVNKFLKPREDADVQKLVVFGSVDDEPPHPIDLINEKIDEYIEVELPKVINSDLGLSRRYEAIINAYEKHRINIYRSYGIDKKT